MILFKKAVRTMWDNKRSYLACVVLIAIGILIYVSMGIAAGDLAIARDQYFRDYRLADVFATVKAIPRAQEEKLLKLPGISDVSMRLTYDARVIMPGNDKIITLRLISVDTANPAPINGIMSTGGGGFHNDNDILLGESFLMAHHLAVGDSVTLIVNGSERQFQICGTATSPEYVYTIKDAKEVLPDAETFSVGYMPVENMANLLHKSGEYNDICFMLEKGYSFDDVKITLEDALAKYGLVSMVQQKDQMSTNMLNTEIQSNMSMATSIPFVFVLMAIIVLYMMLKRVIEQDRLQIGTMKAFGYTNRKLITHYLFYGIVTGAVGGLLGCLLGLPLAGVFSDMYKEFFHLPAAGRSGSAGFIIGGMLMGIAGGAFGAYMGAKNVTRLIPSEAMRPVAPKAVTSDSLRYLPFLPYILTSGGSMAMRSILRNKFRSFFIVVGVTFSFGMLAFMGSYTSMIDDMLMNQFTKVQLYDAKINFNQPVPLQWAQDSVSTIEGVKEAEALMEIPAVFHHNHRKAGIVVQGIQTGSSLVKIYDNELKRSWPPSTAGVILSSKLAEDLEAKTGDTLYMESALSKEDIPVIVSAIVTQNLGSSCYMELGALAGLFHMSPGATSVAVKTDDLSYLKEYVKGAKNVGIIEDKVTTLNRYNEMMGSYESMIYILEIMAIVIAFAIIYNTATISLSERKREFATLRVLGMQVRQVASIMAFEYWVLCILGIILGVPFTIMLKQTLARAIEIDMFTFPTYTPPFAYVTAVIGCLAAVLIANRSSARKIKTFDMVEVLKERE